MSFLIPMMDAKASANFETIKALPLDGKNSDLLKIFYVSNEKKSLPARRARAPKASGTRVDPNNKGIMI